MRGLVSCRFVVWGAAGYEIGYQAPTKDESYLDSGVGVGVGVGVGNGSR
jgi:hypothetical protein